jgi:osmotically inducible protein OsmC
MTKVLYTAAAHVNGGREDGHGRSSDGALDVVLRTPPELGGKGGGTNPEQLFAIGYAACFEGALSVVARRRRQQLGTVEIDARVTLLSSAEGAYTIGVALDVVLPAVSDAAEAAALVLDAHEVCPYSNATRGNVDVEFTVNGDALAQRSPAAG